MQSPVGVITDEKLPRQFDMARYFTSSYAKNHL